MRVNIQGLIDNAKCYQMVRQLRWPEQVECPHCHATQIVKNGHDETQSERQRYLCRMCNRAFDDLTGTVFAGHRQPLAVWMLCLYFMGLNLSNRQIAAELEIAREFDSGDDRDASQRRRRPRPNVMLEGAVECDEVYVVAGHKGHTESVKKRAKPAKRS